MKAERSSRGPTVRDASSGNRATRSRAPISEPPATASRYRRCVGPFPLGSASRKDHHGCCHTIAGGWAGLGVAAACGVRAGLRWPGPSPLRGAHTGTELGGLTRRLVRLGVGQVAIERPDGPVVQALLAAGLGVVVLPGRQVKALRGRYSTAGNKDDRFDAYVLADALRTDGHRLVPLVPDAPQTTALRVVSRARKSLVATRVALANELWATWRSPSRAPPRCSAMSTARSRWPFCAASPR